MSTFAILFAIYTTLGSLVLFMADIPFVVGLYSLLAIPIVISKIGFLIYCIEGLDSVSRDYSTNVIVCISLSLAIPTDICVIPYSVSLIAFPFHAYAFEKSQYRTDRFLFAEWLNCPSMILLILLRVLML